jgi:hypothetical protein
MLKSAVSLPGERLAQVEDEVAVQPRQRVEALQRSVELMQRRLVAELRQRIDDLLLDFLLVERPHDRRLAVAGRLRPLPAPTGRTARRF